MMYVKLKDLTYIIIKENNFMTNQFIIDLENKLQGIGTRLKELHFSAPSMSIHKLVDDFDEEFREFEDEIMENAQGLWGFIQPGDLKPELPEAMDFETLLEDIRGILVSIKKQAADSMMWTGIINIVDDFFATTNKYIYLIKIAKKTLED